MSGKAYQEAYSTMTEKQRDIMYDLWMKAVNRDGHAWNMFSDIKDAVAGILNEQWIPCDKRPPEKSGEYLVTVKWWKGKFITFIEYDADYKEWIDEKACCWKVTAWRPKPIPWEG